MMSILTSAISAVSAAFYSYTPRFPPSISYHLASPSPSFMTFNHYPSISCLYCTGSSLCTTYSNEFSRDVFFKPPQVSSTDNDGGGNEEEEENDEYTNLSCFSAVPAAFYSYTPHFPSSISLPSLSHYTLIIIVVRAAIYSSPYHQYGSPLQ